MKKTTRINVPSVRRAQMNVPIDDTKRTLFKMLCLQEGVSMQDKITQLMQDYIEQRLKATGGRLSFKFLVGQPDELHIAA